MREITKHSGIDQTGRFNSEDKPQLPFNKMMKIKMKSTTLLRFILCLIIIGPLHAADDLVDHFRLPPEETKPWCYWYWLDGDVTRDGITKDLEAMADVGINLAMIGNVTLNKKTGPVKMLSQEWMALTRHAMREANRLGIEIYMFNGPGWSQSGGPWIKPEQSMRRVTWAEFPAQAGAFNQQVRPAEVGPGQDIAVLAVPQLNQVALSGSLASNSSLAEANWIWHPDDGAAATSAPAGTRHFRFQFEADPSTLDSASVHLTADNSYTFSVNGKQMAQDDAWDTVETVPILQHLKAGSNTIAIEVTNMEVGPAGLIACIDLKDKNGKAVRHGSGASWQTAHAAVGPWVSAKVLGPMNQAPWKLSAGGRVLRFTHSEPFVARGLIVQGTANSKLYAIQDGQRRHVADIAANGGESKTDFLPNGIETFSFEGVTAREFLLDPAPKVSVVLTSAPTVAQVIEKQMGRMHPTPAPTWESYIFPATVEPVDASVVLQQKQIVNLTKHLKPDGTLQCMLPEGSWTILYFGMVPTGKKNHPAPPEATGYEVDKMSHTHVRHHFTEQFGKLLGELSPEERSAFTGITIDSYEVGAQNWTDGFAEEFERRNGYSPIALLPVFTGRVIDSAKASDQFLWDLRRTVAEMISECYVGGLRKIAHEHDLKLWCENYGHWGFPGDFLSYGGQTDQVGGEFWVTPADRGTIECRAASSAAHIYGKQRVYAEAFTNKLQLQTHPYTFKARGEQLFAEGINHFVLHVYAHQPKDGIPGNNPFFGTSFHRNTPWFWQMHSWVHYLQRCHLMLQQGEPAADVLVYIGDFAPQMTGPANPVPPGYDYDYIGSDAILRTLHVVDGEWVVHDENDPTRISARWKVLAMPDVKTIRPKVLERLNALRKEGGRVIDGVPVTTASLKGLGIEPLLTEANRRIHWKARRLDDGMVFFLSNFGKAGPFEASLRVSGKAPELFNPVSGQITQPLHYQISDGRTRIKLDIRDPSESYFIVFREDTSVASASNPAPELVRTLAIEQAWETTQKDEKGFSTLHETSFDLADAVSTGHRMLLDLGKVEVMARITLNGKTYDTLWMPPYELDVTESLKPGRNELQVLVTSTSQGKPKLGPVQLRTIHHQSSEEE